jgi:hypothetical protein
VAARGLKARVSRTRQLRARAVVRATFRGLYHRRHSEAAQRFADRRRREDEAPRLAAEVPRLTGLKLEIEERSGSSPVAEPTHVRRIVVEHAPALFALPCGDSRCKDGGHDITHAVMRQLRAGQTRFDGDDICQGSVGSTQCSRVLHYVATATYT